LPHETPQLSTAIDGIPFTQDELEPVSVWGWNIIAPFEYGISTGVVRYEVGGLE
jgi:hypothetical protein